MKRIYIILSFFLCFIIAFSPISYAATGSGEFNPFIEGFPLNEDISLYNSVDTPYHYNFYSDTESLIVAAINSFGSSKNYISNKLHNFSLNNNLFWCVTWKRR